MFFGYHPPFLPKKFRRAMDFPISVKVHLHWPKANFILLNVSIKLDSPLTHLWKRCRFRLNINEPLYGVDGGVCQEFVWSAAGRSRVFVFQVQNQNQWLIC